MRNRMLRRLVAAVTGLALVALAPASLLCPLDGGDATHGVHASAPGGVEGHTHGTPPSDAPEQAPDCPLAFVAGCIPPVIVSSVARITAPIATIAAEPDWLVVAESDLQDTSPIFHPPIG